MPLIGRRCPPGLTVPVMVGLLAEGRLGDGRRLPFLASLDDTDERRAAVALFSSTLDLAVPLGVRHFTVFLGAVPLGADRQAVAHRFARRELLDEDEPGARLWAAARGERRALSPAVMDACRYALDRIVPAAERRDATLALEVAGTPGRRPPRARRSLCWRNTAVPRWVWCGTRRGCRC